MAETQSVPAVIPQSTALAEASADSLGELFSRDPEGYSDQDLDRVIAAYREQRVRWKAAEESGTTTRKATKTQVAMTATAAKAEDLGL